MAHALPAFAAAILAFASPASALSFFDGFEGETTGSSILNYTGFANWTVSDGTVDLVRTGDFGITCRTGNYCVDLDGSTNEAGILALRSPIIIFPGDLVDIIFWLSGNPRGGSSESVFFAVLFSSDIPVIGFQFLNSGTYGSPINFPPIGGAGDVASLAPAAPFTSWGFRFTAGSTTTLTLLFRNDGGDNFGAILDDVSITLTPIPEPATWAMLIAGFGIVGLAARRRRPAAA